MADKGDNSTISRRRLLATAAAVSAGGLAGCSISTPLGDFGSSDDGGDGDTETPSPTPVTTTREPSTRTPTPEPTSTPTPVPTTAPTPTETDTPTSSGTDTPTSTGTDTPTTTGTGDRPDLRPLPPLTPEPCVVSGSCASTPVEVETIEPVEPPVDPIVIPDEPIRPVDPALDPDIVDASSTTVGEPSSVEESGDISVTVTPETGKEENTAIGETTTERRGDMICTTQRRRITSGSGSNFLLNPEISTIWPGEILEAESIARGRFSPALSRARLGDASRSEVRNPLELSISLRNIDGKNTRQLEDPSIGSFRTELDDILGEYDRNASTPAQMNYNIHQVHSSKQLDVQMGVHYDSPKVRVDNEFDFSSRSETNKLFAKFYQNYYTADISTGNPLVTDAGRYLKPNDVIVSSVSYGRILLFSAESKHERTDIENSFSATLNAGMGRGEVDFDIKDKQVLRDTEINAQVLGGSAEDAAQTISKPGEGAFEAVKNFIQEGATYDPKTSPGVPIAYQTKYVGNLDTANTYLTTSYTERNCRPTTRGYRVHNMSLGVLKEADPGNEEELYGDVYVVAWAFPKEGPVDRLRIEPKGGRSDGRVWHRSKSSHVNVTQGGRKDLGVDATLEFDGAHNLDNTRTHIKVTAIPHEKDPTSGDEFGNKKSVKWFLNETPSDPDRAGKGKGKFRERWNDRNSEIELAFDISPIPL